MANRSEQRPKGKSQAEQTQCRGNSRVEAVPCTALVLDRAPIWWCWVAALVIAVAVLGVYWNTLGNEFLTFDDRKYIYENQLVIGDQGLSAIWSDLWNKRPRLHYYPLTYSTFWIEHALVGLTPRGAVASKAGGLPAHPLYHFTQIFLHTINAVLILFVLRALGGSFPVSVFVSAFFALHPVNSATVAWMAERKNLVSAVFLWMTLLIYIHYRRRSQTPPLPRRGLWWRYVLSAVTFVLALCGKAASFVLAPVLIVTDRVLDGRWTWKSVLRAVPFFMLAATMASITMIREQFIAKSWQPVPIHLRPFIAVSAIVHYVGKMLLPIRQAIIYPRWAESLANPRYWLSLAVGAVAGYLIWRYRKRLGDFWLWGLGLFLLTVSPVIGLKDFIWTQFAFVSDHYLYYGSSGVLLMVGLLIEKWCRSTRLPSATEPQRASDYHPRRVVIAIVLSLAALVGCGWRTIQQNRTWKHNGTLWTHTVSISPNCFIARMNLGNYYSRNQDYEQALIQYKEEARIDPHFINAWLACARTARKLNRQDETIQYFKNAVAAAEAKQVRSQSTHIEYADYLLSIGRREGALAEYRAILKKSPANAAEIRAKIIRLEAKQTQ